ncbi:MAG: hypothetical protein JM58_15850 [Peptococcaceae bacterium BICA1-8]|nr:MAG: hypothetical protein JM58_15850 [Peptococcaceae bacterium BICA1-8]
MNLRVKYGKTDQGKFISHLDLIRAWERAFRRAKTPISYSQGFNPHPKVSFGSALAVGLTSTGEYMDIVLKSNFPIQEIKGELAKYLPAGLIVYDIKEIDPKATPLMAVINRAKYLVRINLMQEVNQQELDNILLDLLKQEKIVVLRNTKKGLRERDIRSGIFELEAKVKDRNKVELEMVVETGSGGNVRPEEVVAALQEKGLSIESETINIHREGLYISSDAGLNTPLSVTA